MRIAPPFIAAAMLATVGLPLRVQASLFGEENATLGAILGEDIAQLAAIAKEVAAAYQQVQHLANIYAQGKTLLTHADPNNLFGLVALVQSTAQSFNAIDRDVRYISYKLEKVDGERENVYQESLTGSDPSQFRAKAHAWNGALLESSRVAMRAQTNLDTLAARTKIQQTILSDSKTTHGVVGQLELVIRNLALLHTDMEGIQRSLDTGMRVTANIAAGQASAQVMTEEQERVSLEHYTDPGQPVDIPTKLPRFEEGSP